MSHHPFPWKEPFLEALRRVPVVQHACDAVGILRCTAYRARISDKDFAEAWEDAMEAGVDEAEREAFRRAVQGYEEPVIYQGIVSQTALRDAKGEVVRDAAGEIVAVPLTVRKYSDALMGLILKGRRKKVYADRTELTGADGGALAMTDETARAARLSQLLALAQARKASAAPEIPDDFDMA
jgi:hypothetical protein